METSASRAPRWIDKYEILSDIGQGGMASVYRARLRGPGGATKEVALKLIQPHLSSQADFVRMFLDEMSVAMSLSHRNIVQTFDAGCAEGCYYLVMELMNRGSLAQLVRPSPGQPIKLPLELALFIASELCAALAYAHNFQPKDSSSRGVVHRDISPVNILLSDQGEVKLADFGVAKVIGGITFATGVMIKGKLTYMAPEQARGEVQPRSDLFSLGAVLYRMLTGLPLRLNPSLEQVRLGSERLSMPPALVPPAVAALLRSCLAATLEPRPSSATLLRGQLQAELERALLGQEGPRDPHERLQRFLADAAAPQTKPSASSTKAKRIAEVILAAAKAVPTDHGAELSAAPGGADTRAVTLPSPEPAAQTSASPSRRRWLGSKKLRLSLLATALLLAAAICLGLDAWLAPPPPAEPALPRAVAAADPELPDTRSPALAGQDPQSLAPAVAPPAAPNPAAPAPPASKNKAPWRPVRYGRLDLNVSPWAKVYVDGQYLGVTPLQGIRLKAGQRQLRLLYPPRQLTKLLTLQIKPGQTTRRWIRLPGTALGQ